MSDRPVYYIDLAKGRLEITERQVNAIMHRWTFGRSVGEISRQTGIPRIWVSKVIRWEQSLMKEEEKE